MVSHNVKDIIRNPSYDQLYAEELNPELVGYERGVVTKLGAVNVKTACSQAVLRKINIW